MKKIYLMLMAFLAVSLLGVSCKEEEPFSTTTEDDYPKILDPVFPDWVNGEPAVVSQITHDANFTMKLTEIPWKYVRISQKMGQILKCVVVITADFSGEICKKKIRRKFDCCKCIYYTI